METLGRLFIFEGGPSTLLGPKIHTLNGSFLPKALLFAHLDP